MKTVSELKTKIFADGADKAGMLKMYQNPLIKGFTTNPTLMHQAGIGDYEEFARDILSVIQDLPISFEVFSDDFDEMHRQALKIASWGQNVTVKIPVSNTRGEPSYPLIHALAKAGVKQNVTAIMTLEQVKKTSVALAHGPSAYISVFAGRIADTGRDPVEIMSESVNILKLHPQLELIWASPRELLNIFQADDMGCHIITVTHDIIKKLDHVGKDLNTFSLETVKMFRNDAVKAKFILETEIMGDNMNKVALITGITGQDGAYLAEFLLNKGYIVHGIKRRSSLFNTDRIDHLYQDPHVKNRRLFLHYGDMTDSTCLIRIIQQSQPDEIYNLAAQSHVAVSFEEPEYTANADALGALRVLEAIRILGLEKKTRFYQASTSELYGLVQEVPQKETTPFYPRSPYAVAKLYAYWITINYREAYGMYACNGILFNHESPLRGETFVSRKITRGLARIKLGLQDCLYMGNLSAKRDWGHARDYIEMQWLMLQQNQPEDFVIATGKQYSVRDFIHAAASKLDMHLKWEGTEINEKAYDASGRSVIAIDPRYFRPAEVESLLGDPSKAHAKLGWTPKISFDQLVSEMVYEDLKAAERDDLVKQNGFTVYDYHE